MDFREQEKTLLLYDIAMKLSQKHKVCMIHCGEAGKNGRFCTERLRRIDFWSDNQIKSPINLEDYSAILVDEAHLLSAEKIRIIAGMCERTASYISPVMWKI